MNYETTTNGNLGNNYIYVVGMHFVDSQRKPMIWDIDASEKRGKEMKVILIVCCVIGATGAKGAITAITPRTECFQQSCPVLVTL